MIESQRAVVFPASKQAEFGPLTITGELEPDHIEGRTLASLISPGTELNSGYVGNSFPNYPGYAAVFEVVNVGSDVTDITAGDRVFCSGPHGIGGHRSWQRCARIAAIKLPPGLDPVIATHARLAAVCMTSLTLTHMRPPNGVMITGLGPVGHLAAQVYRASGYEVAAIEPDAHRRALLQAKGFGHVYADLEQAGADQRAMPTMLALECAGHDGALLNACDCVEHGGEVFIIGVPWRAYTDQGAQALAHKVFRGKLALRSGWEWQLPRQPEPLAKGTIFGNFAGVLGWLADGRIDVADLCDVRSPEDAPQVYADLLAGQTQRLTVAFDWSM